MSEEVWRAALKLITECNSDITLGGGEPTLHPNFKAILLEAIAACPNEYDKPFIVTNGTNTELSRLLFKLDRKNVVSARLSYDQYHDMDMVDSDIFELFHNHDMLWSQRDNTGRPIAKRPPASIIKAGRAKKIAGATNDCCCEDIIIKPDGTFRQCGCENAPIIGNVFTGFENNNNIGQCCRYNSPQPVGA